MNFVQNALIQIYEFLSWEALFFSLKSVSKRAFPIEDKDIDAELISGIEASRKFFSYF